MNVERRNECAALWRLKREHEPRLPGRHANMLSGLLAPDWSDCAADVSSERFLEWEVAVQCTRCNLVTSSVTL